MRDNKAIPVRPIDNEIWQPVSKSMTRLEILTELARYRLLDNLEGYEYDRPREIKTRDSKIKG